MTEELKACPFCGDEPVLKEGTAAKGFWKVICKGCLCQTDSDIKRLAVEDWNDRADPWKSTDQVPGDNDLNSEGWGVFFAFRAEHGYGTVYYSKTTGFNDSTVTRWMNIPGHAEAV